MGFSAHVGGSAHAYSGDSMELPYHRNHRNLTNEPQYFKRGMHFELQIPSNTVPCEPTILRHLQNVAGFRKKSLVT